MKKYNKLVRDKIVDAMDASIDELAKVRETKAKAMGRFKKKIYRFKIDTSQEH